MTSRVVIVGSNSLTRHLIDWDQDADYWLFNEAGAHPWVKRIDAVFQMHKPMIWRNPGNVNDKNHYSWLKKTEVAVWMQEHYDDVPASIKYPLDEICEQIIPWVKRKGGDPIRYFTSSASYAIALAIYLGYFHIELVGIEMASDTEYFRQKDGVMFWLGVATGMGIEVIIQDKSLLFRDKMYGYEGEFVIQRQRFEIVSNSIAPKVEEAKISVMEQAGIVSNTMDLLSKETSQDRATALYKKLTDSIRDLCDRSVDYGLLLGALTENKKYISEVDELIHANGGERALQSMVGENGDN